MILNNLPPGTVQWALPGPECEIRTVIFNWPIEGEQYHMWYREQRTFRDLSVQDFGLRATDTDAHVPQFLILTKSKKKEQPVRLTVQSFILAQQKVRPMIKNERTVSVLKRGKLQKLKGWQWPKLAKQHPTHPKFRRLLRLHGNRCQRLRNLKLPAKVKAKAKALTPGSQQRARSFECEHSTFLFHVSISVEIMSVYSPVYL